jgi:hypothetical protein
MRLGITSLTGVFARLPVGAQMAEPILTKTTNVFPPGNGGVFIRRSWRKRNCYPVRLQPFPGASERKIRAERLIKNASVVLPGCFVFIHFAPEPQASSFTGPFACPTHVSTNP